MPGSQAQLAVLSSIQALRNSNTLCFFSLASSASYPGSRKAPLFYQRLALHRRHIQWKVSDPAQEVGFCQNGKVYIGNADSLKLVTISGKMRTPTEVETDISDQQSNDATPSLPLEVIRLPLHRLFLLLPTGSSVSIRPQRRCRLVWLGLSRSPRGQDVQGCHKIGQPQLTLDVRAEGLVVRRHMGPLLDEEAKRAQGMLHILHIFLPAWRPRAILQGRFMGLNLLEPVLPKQANELAGHARPIGREEMSCEVHSKQPQISKAPAPGWWSLWPHFRRGGPPLPRGPPADTRATVSASPRFAASSSRDVD